jgi:hypothetical protein
MRQGFHTFFEFKDEVEVFFKDGLRGLQRVDVLTMVCSVLRQAWIG